MMTLLEITDGGIQSIYADDIDIRGKIDSTFALWQVYIFNLNGLTYHLGMSQSSSPLQNPLNLGVPATLLEIAPTGDSKHEPRRVTVIDYPAFIFAYESGVYKGLTEVATEAVLRHLNMAATPGKEATLAEVQNLKTSTYKASPFLTVEELLELTEKFNQTLAIADSLPAPSNEVARDALLRHGGTIEMTVGALLSEELSATETTATEKLDTLCAHFNLLIASGVDVRGLRAYELAGFTPEIDALRTAAANLKTTIDSCRPKPEATNTVPEGWNLIESGPSC